MRLIRTTRDLGAAIRQARRDRALTQAALAKKAKVSRPWLSELESGKRTVEVGRMLSVLDALDLSLELVATPSRTAGIDLDEILRDESP